MNNPTISRRSHITNQNPLFSPDLLTTDSDFHHPNLYSNQSHLPCFGGLKTENDDSENEDIENRVENPGLATEEDDTELLTELRHLSRNLTTTRSTKTKLATRMTNTVEDFSQPKRTTKEFDQYYQKSVNRFLQKKQDDLDKKRKEKEKSEAQLMTQKPSLISKPPAVARHIPIYERANLVKAKKESDLLKLRKAQEEKEEREFRQLTFAPKINRSSVSPSGKKREISPNAQRDCCGKFNHHPVVLDPKKKSVGSQCGHNVRGSSSKSPQRVDRVMTEPCDQMDSVEGRNSLWDFQKSSRGLSTDRNRSPIGNKNVVKKNLDWQNPSNRKAEEEAIAQKFLEMLGDGPGQGSEMRKSSVKKDNTSTVVKKNVKDTKDASPVKNRPVTENMTSRNVARSHSPISQKGKGMGTLLANNNLRQEHNNKEVEKENIGDEEEIDIVSIQKNLLNIQDNLQTLKQSFRSFQNVQPIPKTYLSFVESPRSTQKDTTCTRRNTEASDVNMQSSATALKDSQIENKSKKISSINPPNIVNSYQNMGMRVTNNILEKLDKNEEKQSHESSFLNKEHVIDNDTEIFFGNGNMSFSAAYENRLGDKNFGIFTNKSSISIDPRYQDSLMSWKLPSELEVGQPPSLETSNLFSKQSNTSLQNTFERRQVENTQSLKDIAEMTLRKFRGLDKQHQAI